MECTATGVARPGHRKFLMGWRGLEVKSAGAFTGLCLAAIALFAPPAKAASNEVVLSNPSIEITLGISSGGVPVIVNAKHTKTAQSLLSDMGLPGGLSAWLPPNSIASQKAKPYPASWELSENDAFQIGKATRGAGGGLQITWVVELAKHSSLFRMRVILTNGGKTSASVDWYPVWNAWWQLPGDASSVRWWDALTFTPHEKTLASTAQINFSNQTYSAADGGTNPFWEVKGSWGSLYFGIGWSGGWQASLSTSGSVLGFTAMLPPSETQLVLKPGEAIEGPCLEVNPVTQTQEWAARRDWMKHRAALAKGPAPAFPLTYNHWFAVKTAVDAPFLHAQAALLDTYGFDDMIVDAGWYDEAGDWQANAKKFQPGELEGLLGSLRAGGKKSGLWSAPQWISTNITRVPGKLETPAVFSQFLQADLLDLWHSNYAALLTQHVQTLRTQFSVDYWKYDQPIFIGDSRAGAMRNVIAFQDALKAVREANPDLTIEDCEDGGHMINEFTLLETQLSWLQDDGDYGLPAARDNIQTALGALDFIFPWSALRFTNLLDEMDQTDDELTRYYCRSAMMGVWGISTDLSKVGNHQQGVIVNEINNYRRLNEIKGEASYELLQPASGSDAAGATFYGRYGRKAAVLCFRWDNKGAFTSQTVLNGLDPHRSYQVTDADTGTVTLVSGSDLTQTGLSTQFSPTRMSALVFIDPVTK
jgi:hypothetical protein